MKSIQKQPLTPITAIGLFLALFSAPLLIFVSRYFAPEPYTDLFVIIKEMGIFALAGLLCLMIIKGEKLSLSSIGLHNREWGKSLLRALIIVLLSAAVLAVLLLIFGLFGITTGGDEAPKYDSLSLWTMTLVVLRAGIVEEVFYRGYVMERLEKISGNFWVFFVLPLVIFAVFHYSQGIPGIIISFCIGSVLAWMYWKKRDLKANIMAHFLVDFIPNVLLPLLAGGMAGSTN